MEIIITTINPPNAAMRSINDALKKTGGTLWVAGDVSGPDSYDLSNVEFLSMDKQRGSGFSLAENLPVRHYCRKNLGYLSAIKQSNPDFLLETDDDNIPYDSFFEPRERDVEVDVVDGVKWENVYTHFSDEKIWPRGYPLEELNSAGESRTTKRKVTAYIQQALADENPDVDAVYRLAGNLPVKFKKGVPLALGKGVWCPFNSQATTTFREAFPLLYLPSYCSFRMTDIWRSFIAQRCLWEMDSHLLFTEAKVYQERNEHNLLKDFEDEVPGYLGNNRLVSVLAEVTLQKGSRAEVVSTNLMECYRALTAEGFFPEKELDLVSRWITDMARLLG